MEGIEARRGVSVVVPMLNEERYVDAVLNDLTSQRFQEGPLEIVVVHGPSSDNTGLLLKTWEKRFGNVKVIENPDRNVGRSFNLGIEASRHEFVAILGAHSRYPEDYLQICMEDLDSNSASACSGKTVLGSRTNSFQESVNMRILESAFGTSSRSFRNAPEGFVETVPESDLPAIGPGGSRRIQRKPYPEPRQ